MASPSTVVRQRVLESLRSPVRRFEQASGGAEALVHLESGSWQMLFLDRRLPDLDAEELSQTVRRRYPGIEVVLLDPEFDSEFNSEFNPKSAAEPGPKEKADPLQEMWPAASHDIENDNQHKENDQDDAKGEVVPAASAAGSILEAPLPGMIGNSRVMQPVYRLARLLAPRNTTVLVTGPTGCGKEVVARAIHQLSPRAGRAFAVVNCAAIPETLLEAELFGYARGAFTGAMQAYAGRIQAAQGGTLFLD
ncbi:MAG: sigma 54-interacting transcriptional regulator, partial [Terriglobales bacterium]